MAIQSSDKGKIFNEINITPLTDIFLVLLIIMMVMAPMFQSVDKNINMPEINNGVNVEDKKAEVSITANAEYFLNGAPVDPANLQAELAKLINLTKEKNIVVKADTKAKSKEIMKVIRAAEFAGFEKLTVAGEPLSGKQQKELKQNSASSDENQVALPEE
ncbi:MAG: biopolymer transporter ExbD [Candidatus Gastranaerophilales bacterium]|nr:biopolymer transporter ExbD [Candidatus Gastranaerophilales bacterium]